MANFWDERRVLVTGGSGFIGSHLVERLVNLGAKVRVIDNLCHGSLSNLDGCEKDIEILKHDLSDLDSCISGCRGTNVVLNLAARVSGISFNRTHSGEMFQINSRIGMNMLEAARLTDVERFLVVSSACVYSAESSVPTPESEGFMNDPETTNWGYGWAKRFAEVQAKAYAEQYGMKIGIVRPYNTYGPRDHFSLGEAHVIPALIKKILDGHDPLEVWGSGEQTRSFIYVDDVVSGMLLGIARHPYPDPINIGSVEEVKIKNLVQIIQDATGRKQKVEFNTSQPQGQARRKPDVSKAKKLLGFEASIPIVDGIRKTLDAYEATIRGNSNIEAMHLSP